MSEQDLQARLEAAKARKTAASAAQAAAEAASATLEAVEVAEREARDAEALAKAIAEHGPLGKKIDVVTNTGDAHIGIVIVKRSDPVAYKRFMSLDDMTLTEVEKFSRPCVVYPDPAAFDRLLESVPGVLPRVCERIAHLMGARKAERLGK